ncbi:MAG: transporter substrate-binding protein, partial [Dehalococcoidia bacterium]|nr:transporter substrate-binding protein [Dehalococcoidia bacterium]
MANIRLLLTAGSVLMLALLLACSPSATPPGEKGATPVEKTAPGEQAAPTEKAPKRGGILSVSNSGNSWHTQDPALGLVPGSIWMRAGSRIIDRNIETYELEPAAIESWEFSPDGKEITMRVRKGMKFHNKPPVNGREVEARDIVYSMKSNAGLQYPGYPKVRFLPGSDYDAMVDAVAVDKYTVKVTLNRRSYSFLHAITNGRHNHVLPDGLREEFGGLESLLDTNKLPQRAIGSGPFVVKKVDNLIEAVFERHPDYWEKGKPYLDGIRGIWLPDRSTELAAFV